VTPRTTGRERNGKSRALPWRVDWWDFTACHDWIGRRPAKAGRLTRIRRAKPPQRQRHDFATREEAAAYAANLRTIDEIVVQIVSTRESEPLPRAPVTPALPGADLWPCAPRRMTGTDWPVLETETDTQRRLREMLQASDRQIAGSRPVTAAAAGKPND
jgi:hypothetical protein